MIQAFKIYKENTTTRWITILIPKSELTSDLLEFKINKYLMLGYKVELINQ